MKCNKGIRVPSIIKPECPNEIFALVTLSLNYRLGNNLLLLNY